MGLPTANQPSGGDRNGERLSPEERARRIEIMRRRKAQEAAEARNAQASSAEDLVTVRVRGELVKMPRSEYEAKKRAIEQRRKAQEQSVASQARPTAQKPKVARSKSPASARIMEAQENEEVNHRVKSNLETRIDPKTGKAYKVIPKVKDGEMPELAVEDFDIDDLQGEADAFMAHLRVPPNAAERAALIAKKQALEEKQKREHDEYVADLEAKLKNKTDLAWTHNADADEDDDDLEKDNKKKGFFSKLFKK